MRLHTTIVGLSAMILSGCYSKDTAPVMSHGQPVTYWVEQLKSPDVKQRKYAVTALGHVGAADPLVVPALIGAVKDKDTGVRDEAVLALLRIGPAAIDATSVLIEADRDPDPKVREHARKALARVQGKT
jgi:HEAT repeat protein